MACLRKKKNTIEGLIVDDSALFLVHPTNPLADLCKKINLLLLIFSPTQWKSFGSFSGFLPCSWSSSLQLVLSVTLLSFFLKFIVVGLYWVCFSCYLLWPVVIETSCFFWPVGHSIEITTERDRFILKIGIVFLYKGLLFLDWSFKIFYVIV